MKLTTVIVAILIGVVSANPSVGGITHVVAVSGAPLPSGNGTFGSFKEPNDFELQFWPSINDSGQIGFYAYTTLGDGVFRADDAHLETVADRMTKFPDGTTQRSGAAYYPRVSINAHGQIGFRTLFSFDESRLVLYDRGVYKVLSEYGATASLNDNGQFATTGGDGVTSGVVRLSVASDTWIAKVGDRPPGTAAGNKFVGFAPPAVNNSGQVAFVGAFNTVASGQFNTAIGNGIFRGDGTTLTPIALANQTPPGGGSDFHYFNAPEINEAGDVAFGSTTGDRAGIHNDGIYASDGATLRRIARAGDPLPDGVGTISADLSNPAINNLGDVVFRDAAKGILLADGTGLRKLAYTGETAPDGTGTLGGFQGEIGWNDAGQALYQANVRIAGKFQYTALFLDNRDATTSEIARTGQSLLGSKVSALGFAPSSGRYGSGLAGLNNTGQVAFYFRLADGRDGIAIWSIPEPQCVTILLLTPILAMGRFRWPDGI